MMKRNILAVVIPALLVAGAANAAEIYNARSKSRPGRSLLIQLRVYKRRVRRNVQGQANSRY